MLPDKELLAATVCFKDRPSTRGSVRRRRLSNSYSTVDLFRVLCVLPCIKTGGIDAYEGNLSIDIVVLLQKGAS